jgi:hypothetical protein
LERHSSIGQLCPAEFERRWQPESGLRIGGPKAPCTVSLLIRHIPRAQGQVRGGDPIPCARQWSAYQPPAATPR